VAAELQHILDRWSADSGRGRERPARVEVDAVASTGSTNTDLLDWAREHRASEPSVVVRVAQSQTAGRGRLGRQWQAVPGASLTFSLAMCLNPAAAWGGLSLAVGHAVAQVLQPWAEGRPERGPGWLMLKWPNDLWWFDREPREAAARARGRKVAGILIETLPAASGGRWVVVGLGVNVNAPALLAADRSCDGVAGTAEWRPQDDAPTLWRALMPPLLESLLVFEAQGFAPLRSAVQARELLTGQAVGLSSGPCRQGWCEGLGDDGALLVRHEGVLHRIVAGEVQVRPAATGAEG
jgi:BirA family biotin operon repressor/biotin-[acetyl-CoA-carboxylase] ligase